MVVSKAVAIFLVMWGHCIYYLCSLHTQPSEVNKVIASFHMPLFMLISGYFSMSSFSMNFKDFLKKKGRQILLPLFSWLFLIAVVESLIKGGVSGIINGFISQLWFLKTLFVCYVTLYLCKKLPVNDVILCFLSVGGAFLIPKCSFLQYNWMLPFFWGGYFLRKYDGWIFEHANILLPIVLLVYLLIYNNLGCGYTLINISLVKTMPVVIILRYIGSLSAAISVIIICFYFCKLSNCHVFSKAINYLQRIGMCTLGNYCIQELLFDNFRTAGIAFHIEESSILNIILSFIISVLLSHFILMIISYTSKKSEKMNLLLWGSVKL